MTLGVTSLYTNIAHNEGVTPCRKAINKREVLQPPTEDLTELIEMIITKKNFAFGAHYLQTYGTAMGTQMDPSYANIFMGDLEESLLNAADKRPDVWWRYIDDVFVIWPFGEGCLVEFLNYINSMHPTVRSNLQPSGQGSP